MRHTQFGYSLISLMIGMIVSLIASLSILSMYHVVIHNIFDKNTGAQQRASQDRQLITSLLTVQNLLQGAGFGTYPTTTNTQLILVDGAGLITESGNANLSTAGTIKNISTISATGNAIFWETNNTLNSDNTQWKCKGILSNPTTKAVYVLSSTSSCDPISTHWSSQTWNITRIVSPDTLANALTFTASLSNNKCSPFGSEIASSALSSAIASTSGINNPSANSAGLKITLNWSSIPGATPWLSCLINFTA